MIKLFTSSWMVILIGAVTYMGTTVALWRTPSPHVVDDAGVPAKVATAAVEKGPSWDFTNPEADQLIAELKAEKKALAIKDQQLQDLAIRLKTEKAEVTQASLSVHQLQVDFDKNVLKVQENETVNLKRLAKVYSTMAPENAANIFAEMDDTSIVKIMLFMKDADNAGILEVFARKGQTEAKRAAGISERLRLAAAHATKNK